MSGLSDADRAALDEAIEDSDAEYRIEKRVEWAVEQIVVRRVAAALTTKADEIQNGPHRLTKDAAPLARAGRRRNNNSLRRVAK